MGLELEQIAPLESIDIDVLMRPGAKGLLIVVDYAETRDLVAMAALMSSVAAPEHRDRVRLLLLARSVGDWWKQLSQADPQPLLRSLAVPHNVLPLSVTADERTPKQIVTDTAQLFAEYLKWPVPEHIPARKRPDKPPLLLLHTEALVTVLHEPARSPGPGERDVIEELLGHEARYWRTRAKRVAFPDEVADDEDLLQRAVAMATLLGADTEHELDAVLHRVPGLAPDPVDHGKARSWLTSLYPSPTANDRPDSLRLPLGVLQPDLIAEHLIIAVLNRIGPADRATVFADLSDGQATRALTVLARTVADLQTTPGLLEEALYADPATMAVAAVRVAREAPGVFGARLLGLISDHALDVETLQRIYDQTPYPSLELCRVAVAVTGQILVRTPVGESRTRALWLSSYSLHLAEVGRRGEALEASREAVTLYRELVVLNRDAYLPNLAASVNNHATDLAEAGRRAEALEASREAVTLYRELVVLNRDAYLPNLAISVNNHANHLAEAGRRAEALEASQEAVTLYRELAAAQPRRLPARPRRIGQQSRHPTWRRRGGGPRRWPASPEAVTVRPGAGRGSTATPTCPTSPRRSTTSPSDLAEAGRRAEALDASQEAVTLYRELAALNRDAYLPDLAMSVNNLAIRPGGGRAAGRGPGRRPEAVTVRRELAAPNRDAYLPDLAMSINNLAVRLARWGGGREALAASPGSRRPPPGVGRAQPRRLPARPRHVG